MTEWTKDGSGELRRRCGDLMATVKFMRAGRRVNGFWHANLRDADGFAFWGGSFWERSNVMSAADVAVAEYSGGERALCETR